MDLLGAGDGDDARAGIVTSLPYNAKMDNFERERSFCCFPFHSLPNYNMEHFIDCIYVKHSRNVKDLTIPLTSERRQHLIITGKNGSGKTSLLEALKNLLSLMSQKNMVSHFSYHYDLDPPISLDRKLMHFKKWMEMYGRPSVKNYFPNLIASISGNIKDFGEVCELGKFGIVYFGAKRTSQFQLPNSVKAITLGQKYSIEQKAHDQFLQYLVNLKANRSFARDDGEIKEVERIDEWFSNLERRLCQIFDVKEIELEFDRKDYSFKIHAGDWEPFTFDKLSDGYSAILSIVAELILRMEAHGSKAYDMQGIVLIDEIETHLHVDLQKKILPFLTDFFPKIQFIVTTHSPFVISSISNATVCDLENRIVTDDLSGYSYDAILESYFMTDKYSEELKGKIAEYESLLKIKSPSVEERDRMRSLKDYLEHLPKYLSRELKVKLQELELLEMGK